MTGQPQRQHCFGQLLTASSSCAAAPAVLWQGHTLSYAQLDERSNRLAHLLQAHGVAANRLVGICVERSFDLAVAVLATLKAGGAYVPLDARYPRARLAAMLTNAGAQLLLTQTTSPVLPAAPTLPTIHLDTLDLSGYPTTPVSSDATDDALAYVIYTSGSTGEPKGVALPRRALANMIAWQNGSLVGQVCNLPQDGRLQTCPTSSAQGLAVQPGQRTLQYTPLSFDVHFQELFGTWTSGGTLVLISEEQRLDPVELLRFLSAERIERLFLPFVALQSLAEVAVQRRLLPLTLREIITAGEQLVVTPALVAMFSQLPGCTLHNHYGPSETHVVTAHTLAGPPSAWPALPPIGTPLPGVALHVLDEQLRPVPAGEVGELFIGGVALAEGYHGRPELTAERFVSCQGERTYRTGDLVKCRDDGSYEFLGRRDGQVKIRGHRVELSEVEAALAQHADIQHAVVVARADAPGLQRLLAYVVPRPGQTLTAAALRPFLAARLPEHMLPSAYVALPELPRTPSGKVDRQALPTPPRTRPELSQEYREPRPGLEQTLAGIWSALLQLERVGRDDNFFELGGNSLLAVQFVQRLREQTRQELPIARFFQYPTLALLAEHLLPQADRAAVGGVAPDRQAVGLGQATTAIAIIGMAGRFPGADDVEAFWRNLCAGVESVTRFREDELHPSIPAVERGDPAYVRARGVLADAESFDAGFFGISPREAELMDPQQRVFLETAWHALENAGYVPETCPGKVGVFAGMHNNSYREWAVAARPDAVAKLGAFQTMLANEKDYLATRTAYALNLHGPALSVYTACSTSLVAVAQAVTSLQARQCDLALAGGVAITCPQNSGYLAHDGGMLAPDGRCRPFDADANGTLFSNGVGIVVLKRLAEAQADGDTIYAVIRGAALNNDGNRKVSFTAPAVEGQMEVIAQAQALAGVAPETIGYVEAHGTATPLGDPIEVEALTQVFRAGGARKQYCGLGSLKSNVGHLVAAAGVAGLMKAVLALHREQIPPTLHCATPNPRIDWENSPFYVVRQLQAWPRGEAPRRAAVSSFGVGGTNAHVVLEEAPLSSARSGVGELLAPLSPLGRGAGGEALALAPRDDSVFSDTQRLPSPPTPHPSGERGASSPRLLLLSARDPAALTQATSNLTAFLEQAPAADLADVAYTLHAGRRAFSQRRFLVASSCAEAAAALRSADRRPVESGVTQAAGRDLVFLFPGQGSQYPQMGAALYRSEPVFRAAVDRCAELAQPLMERDLRDVLYQPGAEQAALLEQTRYTQPAIFTVSYALAQLWLSWGVEPAALLGHSVGEFVAACLAEVFSLEDAVRLVTLRGKLMDEQPSGGMLTIRLSVEKVTPLLDDACSVAAINAPSRCVVAGPLASLQRIEDACRQESVHYRRLHTSHAFHSPMMDPVLAPFGEVVRQVRLAPPRRPILSTVTGDWLTNAQATDPAYWTTHLRATVRFGDAIAKIWQQPQRILLEVGPRSVLTQLARQQVRELSKQLAFAALDGPDERVALLQTVGRLWLAGAVLDARAFYRGQPRRRVPLPLYPFQRQRCWLEPLCQPLLPQADALGVGADRRAVGLGEQTTPSDTIMTPSRKPRLLAELRTLFEEMSGHDLQAADPQATFFELGLDSLVLTQAAQALHKRFQVAVTFRQLLESLCCLQALADYLDQQLPPEPAQLAEPRSPAVAAPQPTDAVKQLIAQQLALMARQLELLGGAVPSRPPALAEPARNGTHHPTTNGTHSEPAKPFGAQARITVKQQGLTPRQRQALADIAQRYLARTRRSKEQTQANRALLADPRVVSGFRPETKEIVYPVVVERSAGTRLWDIDGNEYLDLTCGFGSCFFGHAAPFVVAAVAEQLQRGYEIGPQHPLAGEVAALLRDFTGLERFAFCNTGSEAVLGALRLARTVTGRDLVVMFNGSYHGITDEVIVRAGQHGQALPAAAGIPRSAVGNVLLLDYGTPEALAALRERAHELAAVLVEPVQSRHPELQPRDFLHAVRKLTTASGTALIFDEVITGFRLQAGGAQAYFGVRADLATYGKVIGGGLPIGVIAGQAGFMDALDGGAWQYGDASAPTIGVTYFAGTFVRHPLALAAAKAALTHLRQEGAALYDALNARAARLVQELNALFTETGAPLHLESCGSLLKLHCTQEPPLGELLYTLLRLRGLHIWDARPCFLTTAHTDVDVTHIVAAFREAIAELQVGGFYPCRDEVGRAASLPTTVAGKLPACPTESGPPVPNARLGKDPSGQPAWYVSDPQRPGKYLKVGDAQ